MQRLVVLLALILLAPAAAASAQDFVYPACTPVLASQPHRAFDDAGHAAWYRRFWNGSCAGVSGFCVSGDLAWNTEMPRLLARATADQRADITERACRLGEAIGFEWARDNKVRRISTAALKPLERMLDQPGPVADRLSAVQARVAQLLH